MAFKEGNRYQSTLFPASIEDYVGEDDPVRFYDAFIESLDAEELGLSYDRKQVGNSRYCPMTMLKILVYAYSYGWRSSRKIERALHHNVSFMWLSGGLTPDDRTISEFRRHHLDVFRKVLRESALVCMKLKLVRGYEFFVDGTNIRGNSSINKSYRQKHLERLISTIDSRIDELLKECEHEDGQGSGSLVSMGEALNNERALRGKIEEALEELKTQKADRRGMKPSELERVCINMTDKDAVNMRSRQGSHSGYNVQSTVDGEEGLIVYVEARSRANDCGALGKQVDEASKVCGQKPKYVCADAGYSSAQEMNDVAKQDIGVVVPSKEQVRVEKQQRKGLPVEDTTAFDISSFTYDEAGDFYLCSKSHKLNKYYDNKKNQTHVYKIESASLCGACEHFGKCTSSKKTGKTLRRSFYAKTQENAQLLYASEQGQEIYKKRKYIAERPFGHIKRNLNGGHFLLRGIQGANVEANLFASSYNLVRMMNLLGGVKKAIMAIKNIQNNELLAAT